MKYKKFRNLLIGTGLAFVTSFGFAHANSMNTESTSGLDLQHSIVSQVNTVVQKQYTDSHILSKKVNLHVNIGDKKVNDDDNSLKVSDGQCELNLNYNADGSSVKLNQNQDILAFTAMQNETQKQYQREFIALHEASHCEFKTIENPIRNGLNTDADYTKRLNYEMKDKYMYYTENAKQDNSMYYGYIMGLNETFADTLAMIGMIKTYNPSESLQKGQITNSDLNYVLQSVVAQRDANYIERVGKNIIPDDHFSQEALKELLKPENLKKLSELHTNDEIKEFAIHLSNEGIQKALAHTSYTSDIYSPNNNRTCDVLIIHAIGELAKNPNLTSDEILKGYNPDGEVVKSLATDTFKQVFNKWSESTKQGFAEIKDDQTNKKYEEILHSIHESKEYAPMMLEQQASRSFVLDLRKMYPHNETHQIQEKDISPMLQTIKEEFTNNIVMPDKFTLKNRINDIRNRSFNNANTNSNNAKLM